jgi:hypothetical protein
MKARLRSCLSSFGAKISPGLILGIFGTVSIGGYLAGGFVLDLSHVPVPLPIRVTAMLRMLDDDVDVEAPAFVFVVEFEFETAPCTCTDSPMCEVNCDASAPCGISSL